MKNWQLNLTLIQVKTSRVGWMEESYSLQEKKTKGLPNKVGDNYQQAIARPLVNFYTNNSRTNPTVEYSSLWFTWWASTDQSTTYSYRLHSNELLIDFENIDNHIHCLLRFIKKDFGTNPYKN